MINQKLGWIWSSALVRESRSQAALTCSPVPISVDSESAVPRISPGTSWRVWITSGTHGLHWGPDTESWISIKKVAREQQPMGSMSRWRDRSRPWPLSSKLEFCTFWSAAIDCRFGYSESNEFWESHIEHERCERRCGCWQHPPRGGGRVESCVNLWATRFETSARHAPHLHLANHRCQPDSCCGGPSVTPRNRSSDCRGGWTNRSGGVPARKGSSANRPRKPRILSRTPSRPTATSA